MLKVDYRVGSTECHVSPSPLPLLSYCLSLLLILESGFQILLYFFDLEQNVLACRNFLKKFAIKARFQIHFLAFHSF